jgi:signal transduction histidine kinase
MMERVIQNLVVNAMAYTRAGGQIDVSLEREGAELVFRIENEGEPLSAELLAWINGSEPEGVRPVRPAIGLAIVRKVLLLHGWRMDAGVRTGISGWVNVFSFRMPVYARGDGDR